MTKAETRCKRCGAKARTTGKPCQRWALAGKERCRLHGGKGGRPPIHGRYSKQVMATVEERIAEKAKDPVDLSLNREIHRLSILLEEMQVIFDRGREALRSGKYKPGSEEEGLAIAELRRAIDSNYATHILKIVEGIGRMKERKVKVALATKFLIGIDDLQLWIRGAIGIVERYVAPEDRPKIVEEMRKLPVPGVPAE